MCNNLELQDGLAIKIADHVLSKQNGAIGRRDGTKRVRVISKRATIMGELLLHVTVPY